MAISRITGQDTINHSATASVSCVYPNTATSGDLLIAVVQNNGSSTAAISTWTLLTNGVGYATSLQMAIYYKLSAGSEKTITATATGANFMALDIFEYTGNANPIVTDGTAANKNNGTSSVTTFTTPMITTTNANDLILSAGFFFGTSPSWITSTLIGTNAPSGGVVMIVGENIVSSTKTNFQDTFSWTGSSPTASMIGAFKAAGGVSTPNSNFLSFM